MDKKQLVRIVLNQLMNEPTISVYVMDRSGSMKSYAPVPKTALNQALLTLKESPVASNVAAMVVSFADSYTYDVPLQPVNAVKLLETYAPDGGTALYDALASVMKPLVAGHKDCATRGRNVNVILSIFTDGEDNQSETDSLDEVRSLAQQARVLGWQIYTNGFGVDAATIASRMDLPSDAEHATSYYGSQRQQADNIARSVIAATSRTVISASGYLKPNDDSAPSTPPR